MALEKLQELEDLRLETMASSEFKKWSSSLNVSKLYVNPEPILNARILNNQYDYEKKGKVARLLERIYL